jgi:hypothetical protein
MFNNPYIDSLGPSLNFAEFFKKVYKCPKGFLQPLPSDKFKRQLIVESLIEDWFLPEPKHFAFAGDFHRILIHGYNARPESKYLQITRNTRDWLKNSKNNNWVPMAISRKPIKTVSLFGSPGMGKSSFFDHVGPTMFGKVIKQGNRLQIPFLVLNCSAFNSVKALCINFFSELDNALIQYYEVNDLEYKNPRLLEYTKPFYTAEKLQPFLANEAAQVYLGALVVDEINHLTEGDGDLEKIVNFFKNLTRAIGVPVIFSGTQDAIHKLGINLQSIRRLVGLGMTTWDFYKKDGRDWNRFLTELWKFQVVDNPLLLSEEVKDTFYDLTAGVMDLTIKVHIKCQTEALNYNRNVDSAFIKIVYERFFSSTKKVATAIKSKDPSLKGIYKDVVGITPPTDRSSIKKDFQDVSNKIVAMDKNQAAKIMDLLIFQYPELNKTAALTSSKEGEDQSHNNKATDTSIKVDEKIDAENETRKDSITSETATNENIPKRISTIVDDGNGTVKEKLDHMGISGSLTDLFENQ